MYDDDDDSQGGPGRDPGIPGPILQRLGDVFDTSKKRNPQQEEITNLTRPTMATGVTRTQRQRRIDQAIEAGRTIVGNRDAVIDDIDYVDYAILDLFKRLGGVMDRAADGTNIIKGRLTPKLAMLAGAFDSTSANDQAMFNYEDDFNRTDYTTLLCRYSGYMMYVQTRFTAAELRDAKDSTPLRDLFVDAMAKLHYRDKYTGKTHYALYPITVFFNDDLEFTNMYSYRVALPAVRDPDDIDYRISGHFRDRDGLLEALHQQDAVVGTKLVSEVLADNNILNQLQVGPGRACIFYPDVAIDESLAELSAPAYRLYPALKKQVDTPIYAAFTEMPGYAPFNKIGDETLGLTLHLFSTLSERFDLTTVDNSDSHMLTMAFLKVCKEQMIAAADCIEDYRAELNFDHINNALLSIRHAHAQPIVQRAIQSYNRLVNKHGAGNSTTFISQNLPPPPGQAPVILPTCNISARPSLVVHSTGPSVDWKPKVIREPEAPTSNLYSLNAPGGVLNTLINTMNSAGGGAGGQNSLAKQLTGLKKFMQIYRQMTQPKVSVNRLNPGQVGYDPSTWGQSAENQMSHYASIKGFVTKAAGSDPDRINDVTGLQQAVNRGDPDGGNYFRGALTNLFKLRNGVQKKIDDTRIRVSRAQAKNRSLKRLKDQRLAWLARVRETDIIKKEIRFVTHISNGTVGRVEGGSITYEIQYELENPYQRSDHLYTFYASPSVDESHLSLLQVGPRYFGNKKLEDCKPIPVYGWSLPLQMYAGNDDFHDYFTGRGDWPWDAFTEDGCAVYETADNLNGEIRKETSAYGIWPDELVVYANTNRADTMYICERQIIQYYTTDTGETHFERVTLGNRIYDDLPIYRRTQADVLRGIPQGKSDPKCYHLSVRHPLRKEMMLAIQTKFENKHTGKYGLLFGGTLVVVPDQDLIKEQSLEGSAMLKDFYLDYKTFQRAKAYSFSDRSMDVIYNFFMNYTLMSLAAFAKKRKIERSLSKALNSNADTRVKTAMLKELLEKNAPSKVKGKRSR